ncbi:MAG: NTPase [Chloroflexi bacterium]|nr:NTPase [Chloroflexota bacterium]
MTPPRACFVTGGPGSGKTTLVKQAVAAVGTRAGGFYTEELRAGGMRQGFRIVTFDGKQAVLAHVTVKGPHRVGKYGVDVAALDSVGVTALEQAIARSDLVVVDEIGKMELFSTDFKAAVWQALDSGKPVLGTVMLASHPWADQVKRHPGVTLLTVTRETRLQALAHVLRWLDLQLKGSLRD